ncbi:MAG: hypothetical protein ACFFCS_10765 [Candidatus Hodarchaeota archaeon]
MESEEFIQEAKILDGSVVLQHQKIKNHSNGVKITLKKVLLESGVLSEEKKYTIILLPENERIISNIKERTDIYRDRDPFLNKVRIALRKFDLPDPQVDVTGNILRLTFSSDWDYKCADSAFDSRYVNRLLDLCQSSGTFYELANINEQDFKKIIIDSIDRNIPVIARSSPKSVKSEGWELIVGYQNDTFLKSRNSKDSMSDIREIFVLSQDLGKKKAPDTQAFLPVYREQFLKNIKDAAINAYEKEIIGDSGKIYANGFHAYDVWIESLRSVDPANLTKKALRHSRTVNYKLYSNLHELRTMANLNFHLVENWLPESSENKEIISKAAVELGEIKDFMYENSQYFPYKGRLAPIEGSIKNKHWCLKGITDENFRSQNTRMKAVNVLKELKEREERVFKKLKQIKVE